MIVYKIADQPQEFEWIHQLNYRTFVEEIPQHQARDGRLVDKFHRENTYFIALDEGRLVGMVAQRAKRPFSLDAKLADLDSFLPPGRGVCEMRLLAVEKAYRRGPVFRSLMDHSLRHGIALGYHVAVISATTRQLKLYRHMGFVPFGPLVGTPGAQFQPMLLTVEALQEHSAQAIFRARTDWNFSHEPPVVDGD